MNNLIFRDVSDNPIKKFANSPLGKLLDNFFDTLEFNYDSSLAKAATIDASSEKKVIKETRELTKDEKNYLKEKLEWTDKQIAKCTIDEDGVISYKTDREDLEGQTSENGVPYERKTVEINGVKIEGVFPAFDSAFDAQLPETLMKGSNTKQFKECNNQLYEAIQNDPELAKLFSEEQLEEIKMGETPEGYIWHHNEEPGKMQLVKIEDHDRTQGGAAHTGGKTLWGGGYGASEVSDNSEQASTNNNNNEEV